eukprot:Gregarina_sp_Poly_1__10375@NODE_742_length_6486_cov_31_922729_g553_i0_p1_GENE_NODE_742_length_6486_cov_31_922729_g553_i0NODE_742_length_6486_cov_31_922729_g553_i0_p1_ORF_typecomplete_len1825_score202_40ABC_tran/PF00005_27/1_8e27ABC_tran/PF00005_27/6_4e18ABC2_membrane_3/PF12698_7/1_3e24ABC2_membrane_3/PF12698_7/8_8e21AAA_21/PF13304_6/3e11AAA_21/PF13304_6/2_7ABC2_membrane/PF01061_24/2_1e07ABC2_membrane/PF01061_24/9_4e02ABC2_membrane/PF01061_24/3_7e06AAA_15/PF13175_6/2e05AAA_15/PF13175_6/4_9e03AAA_
MSARGFTNAAYTIGRRHLLIRIRSPLTSLLELSYPCLAVLVLLLLRTQQRSHLQAAQNALAATEQTDAESPVYGVSEEYGAWSLIWVSVFVLPNLRLVQTLMEEKETKVREFIQVYGASDFAYWCGMYFGNFVISTIQSAVITLLCWLFLDTGNFMALFFLTILFMASCVSLSIFLTSLIDSTRVSLFVYTLIYLLLFAPFVSITVASANSTAKVVATLLAPPSALACGLDRFIGGFRNSPSVAQISSDDQLAAYCKIHTAFIFVFLAFDVAVYLAVGWYLYQIRPGPFGVPKRWTFIFQKQYWVNYGREWAPRRKPWATPKTFHPLEMVSDLFEKNYKEGAVEPLVVVDEVHKIFVANRLSFQRFVDWMCVKLDIGVRRPPEGFHALKGVSLIVYPGEITVLMGRNGSGKSTLMSVLSGFLDATSGNVSVGGYDVHRVVGRARQCVGFSPQSTFFLDAMTVGEQFRFAASLKNIPPHIAACDIEVILKMLNIYDKVDWLPKRLSEGEKKRISIGLAFMGNPKVIMIDDLSTGLDVLSRRIVWNALREMKKHRAIIVTSHSPDEACQIADRVAILEQGQLKCNGSPIFLKSRFELGYTLSLIDTEEYEDTRHQVSDIVLSRCPNATLMNALGIELLYKIPFSDAQHIRGLLKDLEYNMDRLGLRCLSIGTTTLTEVLEKTCEDTTAEAEIRKARQAEIHSQMALASYLTRMLSASKGDAVDPLRHTSQAPNSIRVIRRVSDPKMEPEYSARSTESSHWSSLAISADTARWSQGGYVVNEAGYIGNPTVFAEARVRFRLARTKYNAFVRNVVAMFWKRLHCTRKDGYLLQYQALFPAAFILLYSLTLTLTYKSLQTEAFGVAAGSESLYEHDEAGSANDRHQAWNTVMLLCWIVIGCELIPSVWANYVTHERATGSKLHQHAAGIPLFLYWVGELMWDGVVFFLSGILVCFVVWINQGILFQVETAPLFLLALVLFACSSASGAYFLSFFFQSGTTIQAVMIAGGVVIPGLVGAFHAIQPSAYDQWLTWILLLIPHCAFAQICYTIGFECEMRTGPPKQVFCPRLMDAQYCLYPCLYMAVESLIYFLMVVFLDGMHYDPHMRGYLHRMRCIKIPRLPNKKAFMVLRRRRRDSADVSVRNDGGFMRAMRERFGSVDIHKDSDKPSVDKDVTLAPLSHITARDRVTSGRSLISMGLLSRRISLGVNAERRKVLNLVMQFKSSWSSVRRDSDVKRKVSRSFEGKRDNMLVAQGISKWAIDQNNTIHYLPKIRCLRHAKKAINERSFFSVKTGESLGFVGLNGSGMSSMMNMLAGRNLPTQGTLWLEGVNLTSHPYQRFGKVGFCSQVDSGLEGKMSGREIMEMFGRISMISRTYLRRTVIPEALKLVGLKDMKNRPVEQYSQGDKRKLSFILSLINGPRLVLLDSPTSGVDVISRRRIWSVVSQTKRTLGRSVVITSPNPEECEILCDKIAVLKNGRIQIIGDMPSVMARMGSAYQVDVNVCVYERILLPEDLSSAQSLAGHDPSLRTQNNLLYLSLHKSCATELLRQMCHPTQDGNWMSVYKDRDIVPLNTGRHAGGKQHHLQRGKSKLGRMISHLGDIGHTLVKDRAQTVMSRILRELQKYFPGSELVELRETRGRILIPKAPRRVLDLEESIEETSEGEEEDLEMSSSDLESMRSPRPHPAPPAREIAVTVNSTVPTTIPADLSIDDEEEASDICRLGSLTDLPGTLTRSRQVEESVRFAPEANLRGTQSSIIGESISRTSTEGSVEGGPDRRRIPTIESVFRWFDKRRHVFHLMELRVSFVSIETHILLQDKRKRERTGKVGFS